MPRGLAMQKLLIFLALHLAGAIFANSGTAQPVGGPATGGNDPTGGNAPSGNTTGGNATGGNVNTGGNVGVNLGEERRYIVEFQSFKALDETGCNSCGSDEVIITIKTADYALISSEYGASIATGWLVCSNDVISRPWTATTKPIGNGNVIRKEKPAPFSFTVAAYEGRRPKDLQQ